MKKGRHRRYEEARALKRSSHEDLDSLMDRIDDDPFGLPTTDQARGVQDSRANSDGEDADEGEYVPEDPAS